MANKYAELNAKAILLNDGKSQLLPVSKAKLIELANDQKGKFGVNVVDVAGALTYLLGQDATNLEAAKSYTYTSIAALDSSVAARTGYVLSGIKEVDGKLTSYTETWLDASIVSYNGDGDVDDVESALTDIYGKLAAISGEGQGSIKDQINAALDVLDLTEVKKDGQAIVAVSQENGKVSATAGNIKAQYVDVDNADDKFKVGADKTTLTAQATLEQLQSEINGVVEHAATYTIKEVTDGLGETVAKRYKLFETVNNAEKAVGANIDIPKDSSLYKVYLGATDDSVNADNGEITNGSANAGQSLNFVYHLETGKYSLVAIDVSKFLSESEFENGLVVNDHKVSVKVDTDSETFLTVGANGVKLSGVQAAINTAKGEATAYADQKIANLDSSVGKEYLESETAQVITGVTQADGKLSEIKSVALDDAHVKTTSFANEELASLLGDDIQSVTDIHKALNKIAGKVSEGAAAAVTNVVGDNDNTYVKVTAAKSNNTVTLTVDDSALGNVAALKYDVLASDVESVTILGANPTV